MNTIGYWYLDDLSHSEIYGTDLSARQGYLLSDTKKGFGVESHSLFPSLEKLYENLFSANKYQLIPILSILFNPSFYQWLFFFLIVYALYTKNKASLLCCFLLIGNSITLFFGPCVIIRYAFPLVIFCPILFGITYNKQHRSYKNAHISNIQG